MVRCKALNFTQVLPAVHFDDQDSAFVLVIEIVIA